MNTRQQRPSMPPRHTFSAVCATGMLLSSGLLSSGLLSLGLLSVSSVEARPARVAPLRLTEGEGVSGGAYLSQVPALSLRRVVKGRVMVLSGADLAAALPPDLDLSACGERCPEVVGRAAAADVVTHGALFKLGEGYRARVMYSDVSTGEVVVDELVAAPTLAALEAALMSKGEAWAAQLQEALKRAEARPLTFASAQQASPQKKARWASLGLTWVPFKGGVFKMGSVKGEPSERPVHSVEVGAFSLTKSEVTVGQYTQCVEAGACSAPREGEGCPSLNPRSAEPVRCVSWAQASAFASWVGARLPTEAEWAFAARGEQGRTYPWGEQEATCARAVMRGEQEHDDKTDWGDACGLSEPGAVCAHPQGDSPEGLCDLAGGVWEWVQDDWHHSYQGAPQRGAWCETSDCAPQPRGAKVYRGGGWYHTAAQVRGASRGFARADFQGAGVGFRCAL